MGFQMVGKDGLLITLTIGNRYENKEMAITEKEGNAPKLQQATEKQVIGCEWQFAQQH
jgi:hypothetical protein